MKEYVRFVVKNSEGEVVYSSACIEAGSLTYEYEKIYCYGICLGMSKSYKFTKGYDINRIDCDVEQELMYTEE